MKLEVYEVNDVIELEQVMVLRNQVFVKEQGISPDIERDKKDQEAVHFAARYNDEIVGCGRIVFSNKGGKIGRLAVKKDLRGKGIGSMLIENIIDRAYEIGCRKVFLHAQKETVDFYRRLGFNISGEPFKEAGIEHFKMVLDPAAAAKKRKERSK